MKVSISEILGAVRDARTKEEKLAILRANESLPLKTILKYALDPEIEWLLPTGAVPYTPSKFLDQEGMLFTEARRLYLFIKGGHETLKQSRREMLFIQLVEALSPGDAEIICLAKDKKCYPSITPNLVNTAFPGLLSEVKIHSRTEANKLRKAKEQGEE